MNSPRCQRCGHNFYKGGSGLCKWCIKEVSAPEARQVRQKQTTLCTYPNCKCNDWCGEIMPEFLEND